MEKERQVREKRDHDEKEAEKQREMSIKKMKIRFGRCNGRTCESTYQEDRDYCRWVQDMETSNQAVIEFKNFIRPRNEQWEEECRKLKRIELEEREMRIEENRRLADQRQKKEPSAKTVSHQVLLTRLSEIQTSLHCSAINSAGLVNLVLFNTMLPYELVAQQHHQLPRGRDRSWVCIDNQSGVLPRSSRGSGWRVLENWLTEHITQTLYVVFAWCASGKKLCEYELSSAHWW